MWAASTRQSIAQLSLDVLVNNQLVRVSTLHANSNAWCCLAIIPRQLLLWDNFHSKLSIPEPSTIAKAYAFHVSPAARIIGFGFGVHEDYWWSRETANKKSLSINYFDQKKQEGDNDDIASYLLLLGSLALLRYPFKITWKLKLSRYPTLNKNWALATV